MGFTELYERLKPKLKRLSYTYNNRLGASIDRDDLYQEMCMYLFDKYSQGLPEGINEAYVVKGCEFHILNYIRTEKEKVYKVSLEEPINENGDTLKESLPNNSESLDKSVDKKMLVDYIMNNGFSQREKEVFSLLLEGYTVREAGHKLGISHVMVVKLKNKIIKSVTKLA